MELMKPTTPGAAPIRLMPNFANGTLAHRHTVHSALTSLAALRVPPDRIVLRRSGREALPEGTIVRQRPAAGSTMEIDTMVELYVAGLGFNHSLPVGMWDSGGEAAAGTREILEPLDDPLEKLRHWFHEGAPLFRIAPEDDAACARWLKLFGVDVEEWPRALWYRLASLIASVPRLSCSQPGLTFVLDVLLGLPVRSFKYRRAYADLPSDLLSSFGSKGSRLGVDLVVGDAVEDLALLEIELGPVTLDTFERFTTKTQAGRTYSGVELLDRTLALMIPASTTFELRWLVLDQTKSPRLGQAEHNGRLGINSHMGSAQPQAVWSEA